MTLVTTDDRGPVRHVILNRPDEGNLITNEMGQEIAVPYESPRGAAP